jgi:hypothetical protein
MRPDYGEVKERYVNDLLARAVAAHDGLERWNELSRMTVTIVSVGGLWPLSGLSQDSNPREQTITLHEETASVSPFGQPDWRTAFSPGRIAIETSAGALISKRSRPRDSFAGHIMNTPWDPLHRAYFNGYVL